MSDEEIYVSDNAGEPSYVPHAEIDPSALNSALSSLHFLGDDPFMRMQAMNLSIVDPFIADIEHQLLEKLIEEERTPSADAMFVSAQSQMWIFAVYELFRTWMQRTGELMKWHDNGGLEVKLRELEKDDGYRHFGKSIRASQIKRVIHDSAMILNIQNDRKRTHVLFGQLEALRVSLAKHEVRGRHGSVALAPGYGRINRWCGALDFELENGRYSFGYINRRDIADSIRAFPLMNELPTDEELASFDEYMRGPKENIFPEKDV
jgi:hypothetical protein